MLTGTLIKLVHHSQQPDVLNTRLISDHNEKGYGVIEDAYGGGQVYFSHEAVEHRFGFGLLREGQQLEYVMDNGPFLRAAFVRQRDAPFNVQPPPGAPRK